MHKWDVLGTASTAFLHRGTWLHGLQFKAEGQEALTAIIHYTFADQS